ncbi:MAG: hypothetical protein IPM54_29360 [Polyangiaceae bacterium]|nr:hypothetical protein [Polyangiaceae bacterium]
MADKTRGEGTAKTVTEQHMQSGEQPARRQALIPTRTGDIAEGDNVPGAFSDDAAGGRAPDEPTFTQTPGGQTQPRSVPYDRAHPRGRGGRG